MPLHMSLIYCMCFILSVHSARGSLSKTSSSQRGRGAISNKKTHLQWPINKQHERQKWQKSALTATQSRGSRSVKWAEVQLPTVTLAPRNLIWRVVWIESVEHTETTRHHEHPATGHTLAPERKRGNENDALLARPISCQVTVTSRHCVCNQMFRVSAQSD